MPDSPGISRTPTVSGEPAEKHEVYGPTSHITYVTAPIRPSRRSSTSFDRGTGPAGKCQLADDHHVVCYSDLFQPPLIRQWIKDGRLYREAEERAPSRFELFFDLLLVGVVHQLAEKSSENVTGLGVAKVALTFYPAFSVWSDLRNWLNASGVDDVAQRVHTLLLMICLIGYSANASAIEFGHVSEEATPTDEGAPTEAAIAHLVKRAVHQNPQRALVAAMGFFLVAKLLRLIVLFHYAYALPDFRGAHLARSVGQFVVSLFFLGIIFTTSTVTAAILAAVGIFVDILGRLSVGIAVTLERRKKARKAKLSESSKAEESETIDPQIDLDLTVGMERHRMIPAINIEHMIERNAGLVTVVLGESVVSLLYVAGPGTVGVSKIFGRASFSLIVSFVFNALYFDALSKRFVHAIRRHWATHVFWDTLHYPLCLSLILSSSASSLVVTDDETPQAARWQYGGSLGVALICIAGCHMLHQSVDHKGAQRLNQNSRAAMRVAFALIFILLPLIKNIGDLQFLAANAGVASALVIAEIWAKLGTEAEDEPADHTIIDGDLQDDLDDALNAAKRAPQREEIAGSSVETERI